MEFEYTVNGKDKDIKDLLTVDALRMLYVTLPMGGFLAEEGLHVETTDGIKVDVRGSLDSLQDALGMLYGAVDYALLSHSPASSFLAMGAGYWQVGVSKISAKTMKVSISGPSRSKMMELKGIVDQHLVERGSVTPQPEPVPCDEYRTSS